MIKNKDTRGNVVQWIMALIIAVLGGIVVHHYQKMDTVKEENKRRVDKVNEENRKLQEQLRKEKEKDSIGIAKFKEYLETLISSSKRLIASKLYYEAQKIASQIRWTYNLDVELKIEYEKKRNSIMYSIDIGLAKYKRDTLNNFINSTMSWDNSIEFRLTENGGEQVEKYTRFSFFCQYASDDRQSATIIIRFPNSQNDQQIEFKGQGAVFKFKEENVAYIITLLKVEDGGKIDFPTFKLKALA